MQNRHNKKHDLSLCMILCKTKRDELIISQLSFSLILFWILPLFLLLLLAGCDRSPLRSKITSPPEREKASNSTSIEEKNTKLPPKPHIQSQTSLNSEEHNVDPDPIIDLQRPLIEEVGQRSGTSKDNDLVLQKTSTSTRQAPGGGGPVDRDVDHDDKQPKGGFTEQVEREEEIEKEEQPKKKTLRSDYFWRLDGGRNGGGRLNSPRELRFKEQLLPHIPKKTEDSFKQSLTKQNSNLLKRMKMNIFPLKKMHRPQYKSLKTLNRCVFQERSSELLSVSIAYRLYSLGFEVELKNFQGLDGQTARVQLRKKSKDKATRFPLSFKGKGAVWICTQTHLKHHIIHLEAQVEISLLSSINQKTQASINQKTQAPINQKTQVIFQSRQALDQDTSQLKRHSKASRSSRDDHAQREVMTQWSEGIIKAIIPCLITNISQHKSSKTAQEIKKINRSPLNIDHHKCISPSSRK